MLKRNGRRPTEEGKRGAHLVVGGREDRQALGGLGELQPVGLLRGKAETQHPHADPMEKNPTAH